jgi:DMSO reductase family type II enzyme heme b subunit
MDRTAARQATVVAAAVLALLLVAQSAVGAVMTAGQQPMAVRERVATQPDSEAWSDAPTETLGLSAQSMALPRGGGSVGELRMQVMTNTTHVAFRLTWPDPTRDANISRPEAYSDAVAIMARGGSQPPVTMGATGTPVDIWYWRASWQYGNHTETGSWTGSMYAYPHPDEETKPGLAADNPLSKEKYRQYAQNYYARGYGSLSHAPAQNVRARGERTGDGWSVVFVRERTTNGTYDAAFNESASIYLTVAVWNGSADEANGQKSLSYQFLRLDTGSGELATVQQDSGSDSAASGGATTAASTSASSDGLGQFWDLFSPLIAVVVVSWLVAYRSIRGENS